jgi:branched-chain amino acid transport system permease protein
LWGPALGAIPLTLLFEFLSARFPSTSTLIIGVVFLLIVYALPQGVAGLWERVSRRRQKAPPAVPQVQT